MDAHKDTYVPGSAFAKWWDDRLPIMRMMHAQFVDFPTPRNLNYLYTFGAILTFFLGLQLATGIVLSMHYQPSAAEAFDSVQMIKRDVNFGWLLQPMHSVGASMFFLAVYIHMFRGLYYGSYKSPREVLWLIGVLIFLAMMATAFMGYALVWGQMSLWGTNVITNLFGAIPLVGKTITTWLWGGYSVSGATLNRFYSLHFLLPFVIVGLVVLHIWALHVVGQNNPAGIDVASDADTVPMVPYAVMKDLVGVCAFSLVFAWFVFYVPDYLGHADNYVPANPLVTPAHIVPEWYFLPFYAILRAIPSKLGGVMAMFGAVAILAFVPWLDWSRVKSARYRPLYRIAFWAFVFTCLALGYLGSKPAEEPYVTWSRIFTALYFAYFFLALPILGLIETPSVMPRTISEALGGGQFKGSGKGGGQGGMPQAAESAEKR